MTKTKQLWMAALAVLALTVACIGTAAPTISPNAVATIVAATMQAITPLATSTSIPPTATPPTPIPPTFPPIGPTAIVPAATRINFLTGATTGQVSAPIQPGQTQYYVLKALQGQPMIVMAFSLNNDVTLSVQTQGGTFLLNPASRRSTWQGMLPQTEDYYLGVYGGASTENFTLSVEIPSRIQFAQGKDSATVSGKTVAGYNVAYTVFASRGQKMTVNLNGVGNDAALAIYGFTDGQPYVRSVTEQTSFSFKLPATQDYIIEVVPRGGQVVNYTLVVEIK